MNNNIEVIGFDADDTLWVNENYYREAEDHFAELLSDFGEQDYLKEQLFQTEMKNLELFGYGIKPFVISLTETAIRVSGGRVPIEIISSFIETGREMLQKPIELLPGVKEVLSALHGKYRLIVATKGDLLDQERKLKRSSLSGFFHHIEIMSDKTRESYQQLLDHLEIPPEKFLMIGNSLRSDILPPYELGCKAIYIPYHLTWAHELNVEEMAEDDRYKKVESLVDVLSIVEAYKKHEISGLLAESRYKVKVRQVRKEDDAILGEIIRNSFMDYQAKQEGTVFSDSVIDRLSESFDRERSRYFVLEGPDGVLGGAGIQPLNKGSEEVCELQKMYIKKEARGKGLGRTLLEYCLDFAREAGFTKCYLESLPELKDALKMYEAAGFSYIPERMGDTGYYGCSLYMILSLD